MSKVLVIGCGGVASVAISKCCQVSDVFTELCIASTFPISKVYQAHIPTFAAGYWLFGFASKKYHPINDMDSDAWNSLNMRTRYYTTRLHVGAFYLPAFLEEMLREVEDR